MQQEYFHCSPTKLGMGSIIEKGNWGRIIARYQPPDQNGMWPSYRETMLELARKLTSPHKPSRLDCVFVLKDMNAATAYRNAHCPANLIYKVKPVVENPSMHIGSFSLITRPYQNNYLAEMLDQYENYWSDSPKNDEEVLLGCDVEIVERYVV
jgi:Protein of unknown function (DUF2441)